MNSLELLSYSLVIIYVALTIFTITIVWKLTARNRDWKNGAVPNSEEIANKKVKELASRLKGESDKETLTNVLEWQNRNMTFWLERYPMPKVTSYSLVFFIVGLVGLYVSNNLKIETSVATYVSLWFLAMTIMSVIISMVYICYGRNLKLNAFLKTFKQNLPVEDIVENRLGVCRDYAKLTACLLINLYPDSDIYFAHTPNHVAVGITSNGQLYMMDQKLPILTINQWVRREKKAKIHRLSNGKIEVVKNISNFTNASTDLSSVRKDLLKILNINEGIEKNRTAIKILTWKKGTLLYAMNDEVVNYSLAQRIKLEKSNELMELEKVYLEIEPKDSDLVFSIYSTVK